MILLLVSGCATRGPNLAQIAQGQLPMRVELRDVPFFPQDEYQCGPAALATVLRAADVAVTPQELVARVYLPGRKGSLQTELIAATRTYDRVPYVAPLSLADMLAQAAAGMPVLVLQNLGLQTLPAWHFAVLVGYDIERNRVLLRSGTTARLEMDARRFLRTWSAAQQWAMVALRPGQLPARANLEHYMSAAAGLEAIGRFEASSAAYARARDQWPDSPWPVLGLANLSLARGDLEAAERGYAAALSLEPGNVTAQNNLAELLGGRGCLPAAREHSRIALRLARNTALEPRVARTAERIAATDRPDTPPAGCPVP